MTRMFAPDLLHDKVILITGGGTGLGRAMGEKFLQLGAKVAKGALVASIEVLGIPTEVRATHGGIVAALKAAREGFLRQAVAAVARLWAFASLVMVKS